LEYAENNNSRLEWILFKGECEENVHQYLNEVYREVSQLNYPIRKLTLGVVILRVKHSQIILIYIILNGEVECTNKNNDGWDQRVQENSQVNDHVKRNIETKLKPIVINFVIISLVPLLEFFVFLVILHEISPENFT